MLAQLSRKIGRARDLARSSAATDPTLVTLGLRLGLRALSRLAPRRARMGLLLRLHNAVRTEISSWALAESPSGAHPKHRFMRTAEWFLAQVNSGDAVCDLGCGNGGLLAELVKKTGGPAVGVELSPGNAAAARHRLGTNATIYEGDLRHYEPDRDFDAVILSAVLEHLPDRVALLSDLHARYPGARLLIRVPQWDRDWLVPLMEEHAVDSRLDHTHELEYTEEVLRAELRAAGFRAETLSVRWGELFAAAVPGPVTG